MNSFDEGTNSVVIGVIKDLTKTVEDSKQQLAAYEASSALDRAAFKQSIEHAIATLRATNEESIIQLRKDFQRSLMPFLMDSIDHKQVHIDDRKDALDQQRKLLIYQQQEALERTQRQAIVDKRFTILTVVLVIVFVLVVVLLLILILRIIVISRG